MITVVRVRLHIMIEQWAVVVGLWLMAVDG
jgi:hypothetical protein